MKQSFVKHHSQIFRTTADRFLHLSCPHDNADAVLADVKAFFSQHGQAHHLLIPLLQLIRLTQLGSLGALHVSVIMKLQDALELFLFTLQSHDFTPQGSVLVLEFLRLLEMGKNIYLDLVSAGL